MLIMSVDPASGATSRCGVALFDTETRDIYTYAAIGTSAKTTYARIQDVCGQVSGLYMKDSKVWLEAFVMRGKSGETLQRLIGGIIARLPKGAAINEVYNTTVKKAVGGHGGASKEEVALGVLKYFTDNKVSSEIIKNLIYDKEYDILDAFAIGIAGSESK